MINTSNRKNLTLFNSRISGKCSDKKIVTPECLDRRIVKEFPAIMGEVDPFRGFLPSVPATDTFIVFQSVFWPGPTSFRVLYGIRIM
jgi:hypothetical protein